METIFRAWDFKDKKMIYSDEEWYNKEDFGKQYIISFQIYPKHTTEEIRNCTYLTLKYVRTDMDTIFSSFEPEVEIKQGIALAYTNCKDKNGKMVYCGDIVKDGSIEYPYLYEIYWHDEYHWSMRMLQNQQFSGSLSDCKHIVPDEMKYEVIGNIYENTDYVNKQTK